MKIPIKRTNDGVLGIAKVGKYFIEIVNIKQEFYL